MKRLISLQLRSVALIPLLGCGTSCVYQLTGDTMSSYATEHMVPYLMGSDDVDSACQTGASLGTFLLSFERVHVSPDRIAVVSLLAAGMCAESRAWEAELSRLRAAHAARPAEAQDALIREKGEHALAARRFYAAYRRLNAFAAAPQGGGCPKVASEDELLYLLGSSAGVLAVLHDKAADGTAGVPSDIPAAVQRSALCVSNDRWWGVPAALQAAIWVAAPPLKPANANPWHTLEDSAKIGALHNVRLASAFQIQAAVTAGNPELARGLMTAFAATVQAAPADPNWRLLDTYGQSMILHESDKIWTEDTGHRTPFNALGTFPGVTTVPAKEDNPFAE